MKHFLILLIAVLCVPLHAADKPNIILIMTDDQGYAPIGRHGNTWIKTPNLDALHDKSVRFTKFMVAPTCAPTRSALMTGRHPEKNGITHTINERERMTLNAVTLPQVLKTAGYSSGIFGKWHLGDEDAYQPQARGFDEAFIHGAGGIGQFYNNSCADAPKNTYFDPVIRHNGRFVKTRGFCTDVFFTAAMGWMKQRKDSGSPFFAYITPNAPHSPYTARPEDAKRFLDMGFKPQHAGFYGMIENIDANVGRLMASLEQWKLLDNTVVIFMSDNGSAGDGVGREGTALGKSADGAELKAHNAGMKGYKNSPEEGGVRVPFFVRWDGHFPAGPAGREVDRLAGHIDVFPTLAALAGAKLPEGQVEGRSLLPLLEKPEAAKDWADRHIFAHVCRWPIGAEPNDFRDKQYTVRSQKYRLVNGELYDMDADPGQKHNIAAERPEIAAKMKAAFDQYWKEARPLMVNESAPQSKTRPYWLAVEKQGEIPEWKPAP